MGYVLFDDGAQRAETEAEISAAGADKVPPMPHLK